MKTSTKLLIVFAILTFIPSAVLSPYLFEAIVPTGAGFTFNFSALSWIALALNVIFNVIFGILFFRFLKTLRLRNALFFSLAPLTLVFAFSVSYVVGVKNMTGTVADSVRATLKIQSQESSIENYLWVGLLTLVYLVAVFVILYFACKPLTRVQRSAEKLGDGRTKYDDDIHVGGGKQFQEIQNSLNKINYNYKEKDNKLRQTDLEAQKNLPKQFFRFLGKNSIEALELGGQVRKTATTLFCDLQSSDSKSRSLSLEENFNYINSYIKIVSPYIRKFDGFIDKFLGDGVLAVFGKPQDAIECAHAIARAVDVKNKSQKELPAIDARMTINTAEVVFGIVGDDERKMPSIISDDLNLATKMEEINQFIGTKILMTKATISSLPQNFDFSHRYVGDLTYDDIQIPLFESLFPYTKGKRDKLLKLKSKFEAGVRSYNEKNYQSAKEFFEYVLHYVSDDKPSFVYFNSACEKLKTTEE